MNTSNTHMDWEDILFRSSMLKQVKKQALTDMAIFAKKLQLMIKVIQKMVTKEYVWMKCLPKKTFWIMPTNFNVYLHIHSFLLIELRSCPTVCHQTVLYHVDKCHQLLDKKLNYLKHVTIFNKFAHDENYSIILPLGDHHGRWPDLFVVE